MHVVVKAVGPLLVFDAGIRPELKCRVYPKFVEKNEIVMLT